MRGTILLTAGGTGGHLFPAQALAGELARRGWSVDLATDERADQYGQPFPARTVHIIASETLRARTPVAMLRTALSLARGTAQAIGVIRRTRPAAVVGFGGYPTFPPMLAARLTGTPSILHEANAVMGRANRMLARGVKAVATSVPIAGLPEAIAARTEETGNPVRPAVIEAAGRPYCAPDPDGPFHLLVFGGSQGARFFSDLVPPALERLSEDLRRRLRLVQQCRPEDLERVRAAYDRLGVEAELAAFFGDLPQRIGAAHLVVCRSGASSVSELAVIGRPAILVPLPHALDQDQSANAAVLERAGAAWPVAQKDLDADRLAGDLARLMQAPKALAAAAAAARANGKPDAVARLADLVERIAAGGNTRKGDGG
ncbi:undecaprenyldiphospho-muramoylpentapeptide beta-N-acetylglucosaminyltransferase [Polymorphum gilvum]|uniref:UDP-N-acetylglucosamine--N-acetylmuramyl-(pentapeptide) pyrophosphoryl-undecaprenol N-acetylglucosamine transferase n=1 Tax=Polymorphum gilvum (strain LMG 25793 / CGMCC 1.9160 / SL003B-26A1) TaxID=991905 RepID=F2J279_POLGS|nr:undecaprenyldiphospho-muramoylpentapeptide beta-N-acetylglucosaminyltransferase [Polymorphum gilvum]ADZ69775.1 UDP-N-acetylglucosamine--N-acetylmuramyl-(pentapeptide) pyrophosphoryl-undecaprenol N-acetylglucosamine transferase [Polymorphum gilvum SL003B-26A1]